MNAPRSLNEPVICSFSSLRYTSPPARLLSAAERRSGNTPDRFESQELMLHERVRRAFRDIAEEEPDRCVVIDASQPEAMVAEDVWEVVLQRLSP